MSTLREDFERHMSECGRSVGLRDEQGFYIADHVEQRWQSYQAATERAAQKCEERATAYRTTSAPGWVEVDHECSQCAAAIRSGGEAGS